MMSAALVPFRKKVYVNSISSEIKFERFYYNACSVVIISKGWSCWLSSKQQFEKIERLLRIVGQKKLERGMDDTQEIAQAVSRDAENTSSRKLQKTCGNRKE